MNQPNNNLRSLSTIYKPNEPAQPNEQQMLVQALRGGTYATTTIFRRRKNDDNATHATRYDARASYARINENEKCWINKN